MARNHFFPFPFPQRPEGHGTSHELFYLKTRIYNPFFITQKSPILSSNLFPYQNSPYSTPITAMDSSSQLKCKSSEDGFLAEITPEIEAQQVEPESTDDYEYSLEMNPVWIERLSNTMKRIKKKKKKKYPY